MVLVGATDLLDQAVQMETLEHPGYLGSSKAFEQLSQRGISETTDRVLASRDCAKQIQIVAAEEIEPAVRALVMLHWFGNLLDIFDPRRGIF